MPVRTALHWARGKGAERCIDGRELARRVEDLTGPLFVAPAEAERGLEGSIEQTRRGFTARIVSVAPGGAQAGERRLSTRSSDCRALDAALVFVVTVTVDPERASSISPALLAAFAREESPDAALLAELEATPPAPFIAPEPAPEPAPDPQPEPHSQPEPEPEPAVAPSARDVRVQLMLGAAWLGRTVPGWSPGPEARAQVDVPHVWPLALTLRAFPRAAAITVDSGAARLRAYAGALTTCPLSLTGGRIGVQACLGAGLTYLRGQGTGFARNHAGSLWEPSLLGETLLRVALFRGLGLYASAAASMRLTRQHFALVDARQRRELFDPPRIGVTLATGASYAF